jgi:hypothetical protein
MSFGKEYAGSNDKLFAAFTNPAMALPLATGPLSDPQLPASELVFNPTCDVLSLYSVCLTALSKQVSDLRSQWEDYCLKH